MSLHNLARRGIHVVNTLANEQPGDGDDDTGKPINPLALLIIVLTFVAFLFVLFTVNYTYSHILPTLCMVESPETTAYVPVDNIASDAPPAYDSVPKPDEEEEGDVLLVQNKPITSSIRATLDHLRAKAGYWSRFRGLAVYMVWTFASQFIASLIGAPFHHSAGYAIAAIFAEVLLARYHMTWIHIVISEPSTKRWWQRVPPWSTWKKVAPAVALWALCTQITVTLPMIICGSFGSLKHMKNPEYEAGPKDLYVSSGQIFFGFAIFLMLLVGIQIPATVTMVRVSASMLPEEDETIVSFDRTFGGKTTPAIVGGQGKIGIVEAWKSFPRTSRVRLLKLMAKVAAIAMTVWAGFIIVLTAEAHIMLGENVGAVLQALHGSRG